MLVFDVEGNGFQLSSAADGVDFDMDGTGRAVMGGMDAFDTGLSVTRDLDVRVDFSRGSGVLYGTVQQRDGTAASAYYVVVFPSPREQWNAITPRIRVAPVAADGSFEVAGLAPGRYLVEAAGITGADDVDALLLETLRTARDVTVAKDTRLSLALTVE